MALDTAEIKHQDQFRVLESLGDVRKLQSQCRMSDTYKRSYVVPLRLDKRGGQGPDKYSSQGSTHGGSQILVGIRFLNVLYRADHGSSLSNTSASSNVQQSVFPKIIFNHIVPRFQDE